jgi:hypothetical protein
MQNMTKNKKLMFNIIFNHRAFVKKDHYTAHELFKHNTLLRCSRYKIDRF